MQARNAHFNLVRLGATAGIYAQNFYGTDSVTDPDQSVGQGIDSDRLFASWDLRSERVLMLASRSPITIPKPVLKISIPTEWTSLVKNDPARARAEQLRVRSEFTTTFSDGLICAGFERSPNQPSYLLFQRS